MTFVIVTLFPIVRNNFHIVYCSALEAQELTITKFKAKLSAWCLIIWNHFSYHMRREAFIQCSVTKFTIKVE